MAMAGYIILMVVMVLLAFALSGVGDRKALFLIEAWAQSCQYSVESCERRYLRTGPFFLSSSKYQRIYYVRIKDRNGQEKTGWLKLGGYFSGMLSEDEIEVIWE